MRLHIGQQLSALAYAYAKQAGGKGIQRAEVTGPLHLQDTYYFINSLTRGDVLGFVDEYDAV
jgi:hypothetical protein